MTTIAYFSNGTTAEIENVRGHDPRTFRIPAASYGTFQAAFGDGSTMSFSEGGEVYLLTQLKGDLGTAVLQVTRR